MQSDERNLTHIEKGPGVIFQGLGVSALSLPLNGYLVKTIFLTATFCPATSR